MVVIKVVRGRETLNVCRYVLQPSKIDPNGITSPEDLIVGNMASNNMIDLSHEFAISQCQKPRVKVNIVHYSVSFPPGEDIDLKVMKKLSWSLLCKMGHSPATQFFAVKHFDEIDKNNVAHFHIVASAIGLDGRVCKSSWDRLKVRKAEREIEIEFKLTQPPNIEKNLQRPLTIGESRQRKRLGKKTAKEELREILDVAAIDQPAFSEFVLRLEVEGVEVRLKSDEKEGLIGISYGFEGMAYGGYHLGKRYTLQGLEKDLGVQPAVDAQVIDVPPVPEPKEKKRSRGLER
jgi:hypothetical protein